MEQVEVVVAHFERATLRVGDMFVKVDGDQRRLDIEVDVMTRVPVPTPEVLWRKPHVLALAAVPGTALGRLETPSTASPEAWAAAGAAVRTFHDAPLPPWPGKTLDDRVARLDRECEWLLVNDVLPASVIARNRALAETAMRPWKQSFIHGDLQICHVFVDDQDEVTAIIDWSEGAPGDAMFDLATLSLAQEHHLDDLLDGYGRDAVDVDLIRAWWAWRCLVVVQWLVDAGYGAPEEFTEVAVLRSLA